jgi:hypothetical protein
MNDFSDAELLKIIFPGPESISTEICMAWAEFLRRSQWIVLRSIKEVYAKYYPQAEPQIQDIYAVLEEVMFKLYEDKFKLIREAHFSEGLQLEQLIGPLAVSAALDYVEKHRPINSATRDEPKT